MGIFILLGLNIVCDLAYIVIPGARLFIDSVNDKTKKRKFVSVEAVNAVMEQESKNGTAYVNPVGIYFKSRVKQIIALSLCLVYLVSGEIYNLIGSIMDYINMAINV